MVARTRFIISRYRWLTIVLILVISAGIFFLARPGGEQIPPFPTYTLRVGVDPSYPPFALLTEENLEGIDIELAHALGEELGLPVDLRLMGIDGLYDALRAQQVDVLISSLKVENWRLGDVVYSQPYFDAGLLLVSNKLDQMDDLPGHSIAYEFGSDADAELRRWSRRIQIFETRPYEIPEHALDAVRLGDADAAMVDAISARLYMKEHPGWQINNTYITHEPYVIAVYIYRPETTKAIHKALSNLLESGKIQQIIDRWL